LLDDVLVAVARSVRRWADRVLTDHAHETSALEQREPPAPRLDLRPDLRPDSRDDDSFDEDGPPAHWIEMVRDRAPHLLPPGHRGVRRSADDEALEAWPEDALQEPVEPETVTDEPAAVATRAGRDGSSRDRDREQADRPPAVDPGASSQASVPAVPGMQERREAREAREARDVRREDVRSPPPLSAPPPVTTVAAAPALGPAQARTVERAAGEASHDPSSPRAVVAPSDVAETIGRGGARTSTADRPRYGERDDGPRARDVSPRTEREAERRAEGKGDATRSEATERSPRRRAPGAVLSETVGRSLRWYRAPDPVDAEPTAAGHGDDVPARGKTARAAVRRLRDPARGRHDAGPVPAQHATDARAAVVTAASRTPGREASPARDRMLPPRRVAEPGVHATRTLRPREAGAQPDPVPLELPRSPVASARGASAAYEPTWDAGAAHAAASPWQAVEHAGRAPSFSLSSEMCAALWPRLPDEGDDANDDRLAAPRGLTDDLWPRLAVDELVPVEEPAHCDPARDERLRREQRGMRWSERRS
jgi:hypothetical protein